jgi:DNA-binding MarR family transcriptional regulator
MFYICPKKEMRKKVFSLPKREYLLKHLEVLNSIIPVKLSPTERQMIAILLDREEDLVLNDLLSKEVRKKLREELNMSYQNLSARLKRLKNEGFIYLDPADNKWKLIKFLLPDPSGRIEYVIIVKDKNRNERTYR